MDLNMIIDYLNEGEEISFRKEHYAILTISATELNEGIRKSLSVSEELLEAAFDPDFILKSTIYDCFASVRNATMTNQKENEHE